MVFSGHIAPPVLGAALASARIHLSPEIASRQEALQRRIAFCNDLIREHDLPLVGSPSVPIRYIGVGPTEMSYGMVSRLMQAGFFTNVGIFPAVSVRRAGVRFTLTCHHHFEDIRALVEAIAELLPVVAREQGVSLDAIREAFHLPHGPGRGVQPSLACRLRAAS
jgi:7-keto-8-aminopelargonate synthetase-like enzyme